MRRKDSNVVRSSMQAGNEQFSVTNASPDFYKNESEVDKKMQSTHSVSYHDPAQNPINKDRDGNLKIDDDQEIRYHEQHQITF